ncbi:MAG: hypothetical protein ACK8QZ_05430, partial [Anaerolineales bacterium]
MSMGVGSKNAVCLNVAVGKTKPPLPLCPLFDGGGLGVFVHTGGTGVAVGTGVSEGVAPGGSVAL